MPGKRVSGEVRLTRKEREANRRIWEATKDEPSFEELERRLGAYPIPLKPHWIRLASGSSPGAAPVCVSVAAISLLMLSRCAFSSGWDQRLPDLELGHVAGARDSLEEAWTWMSHKFMIRSVLYVSDETDTRTPFRFEKADCQARDLLDAVQAQYPAYQWSQDKETGVIWIHPRNVAYDEILPQEVVVEKDQLAVPAQEGVLQSLVADDDLIRVKRWGDALRNTHNYPVDLPKGTHSVRRILNLCCAANPTKSFYIRFYSKRGFHVVTAFNLTRYKERTPPGALHLWKLGIGEFRGAEPSDAEVQAALSDHDPRIRRVARHYLETVAWNVDLYQWAREIEDTKTALWTVTGISSIMVRIETRATHVALEDRLMREIADGARFSNLDP